MTAPVPPEEDTSIALRPWQDLSAEAQAEVLSLQIDDRQLEYAGTVQRAVDTCTSSSPHEVAGLAILVGSRVAGFLVLRRGGMRPEWAPREAAALTGMRIDRAFQGRGIGQAALRLVDGWLVSHWPDALGVALSVDAANLAGRSAYQRAGYTEFAAPKPGRIGTVHYLCKVLARA